MANISTQLRELSVALTIALLKNNINFDKEDLYNGQYFYEASLKYINGIDPSIINDIKSYTSFPNNLQSIINNGYNLGQEIFNHPHFKIEVTDEITWSGNDTSKDDPIDISVGAYDFSLKEESFILENMGLYKLVNLFTGSNHSYQHIFKDYSKQEFENWFLVTWSLLIDYLNNNSSWTYINPRNNNKSIITIEQENILMRYITTNETTTKTIPKSANYIYFKSNTNSKIRENVFSKFINIELINNPDYISAKKECAIVASDNLANHLKENLEYDEGLARFLRIHEEEYYYAKSTDREMHIYRVPSEEEFGKDIVIESIEGSVPGSQANILTTIKNNETGSSLTLRNECRYSHGQFNGTPEAKLYYGNKDSLLTIYEELDIID